MRFLLLFGLILNSNAVMLSNEQVPLLFKDVYLYQEEDYYLHLYYCFDSSYSKSVAVNGCLYFLNEAGEHNINIPLDLIENNLIKCRYEVRKGSEKYLGYFEITIHNKKDLLVTSDSSKVRYGYTYNCDSYIACVDEVKEEYNFHVEDEIILNKPMLDIAKISSFSYFHFADQEVEYTASYIVLFLKEGSFFNYAYNEDYAGFFIPLRLEKNYQDYHGVCDQKLFFNQSQKRFNTNDGEEITTKIPFDYLTTEKEFNCLVYFEGLGEDDLNVSILISFTLKGTIGNCYQSDYCPISSNEKEDNQEFNWEILL